MKLLIVDDEPLIHVSIEYCLKELELSDVEVLHAYTGAEMWKRLEEAEIDIALVDIRMPGVNGLEAIEQGKQRWPDTFYYIERIQRIRIRPGGCAAQCHGVPAQASGD